MTSISNTLARRLYCALVLPMDADSGIDEEGLRQAVRYFTSNADFARQGGLIANSEAGEIFTLTPQERRVVLDIVLDEVNGRFPVLGGVFGLSTRDAVEAARDVKAAGASGVFLMPPAGSMDISMSWDSVRYPEVWLDQIKAQDRAVDMPIFTHPLVSTTPVWGFGLPLAPTLQYCREVPNIVGWKTTYAYLGNRLFSRGMREHAPQVALLCASGHFFHEFLASGHFDGTITGSWNYAMEPMLAHIDAWRRNDVVEARRIWDGGLAQLHEYIYSEPSRLHVRYKLAACLRGIIRSPRMRAPMPAPRPEEIQTLTRLLAAAGLAATADRPVPAYA